VRHPSQVFSQPEGFATGSQWLPEVLTESNSHANGVTGPAGSRALPGESVILYGTTGLTR